MFHKITKGLKGTNTHNPILASRRYWAHRTAWPRGTEGKRHPVQSKKACEGDWGCSTKALASQSRSLVQAPGL